MSNLVKHAKEIKAQEVEEINYLKQEQISSVLSIALGELYIAQPKNQLNFLGNWLLNHSAALKNQNKEAQITETQEVLRAKHEKSLEAQRQAEAKLKADAILLEKAEEELKAEIANSLDIEDFLPQIIQYLKTRTFAAAGYIGLQEKIKRQITPMDDEKAHIDEDSPFVIRYIAASEGSCFMLNQILKEEEGQATWSLWKEDEEEVPDEELEENTKINKPKVKIISVDDVVSDIRVKFFDVPKLGAYFAVPLNYKSCLTDSSFDAGVDDAVECRKLRAQQEDEKLKGEGLDDEPKVFEEIKENPFRTNEVRMVIALDTLGQDKVFNEDQKNYVVDWVLFLQEAFERTQNECLRKDIDKYVKIRDKDQQRLQDKQVEWADEEKNAVEDFLKPLPATAPEDLKQLESQKALFELYKKRLLGEIPEIFEFVDFKVVKFLRVIQIALYLSGVLREDIVEPGTNMAHWKITKKFLNSNFQSFFENAKPFGPNPIKPQAYAGTLKLEADLKRVSVEEVQNYSVSLFTLYKYLEQYFKLRIFDVTLRRKLYLAKVEIRENALKAAEELAERRQKVIDDAKETFEKEIEALEEDAEKPIFEVENLLKEFDEAEGNENIEIPEEVFPDVDEDIAWEDSNPS